MSWRFCCKENKFFPIIANSLICLLLLLAVYFLYYFCPVMHLYLIAEDWLGEYTTALCYIFACIFIMWAMAVKEDLRKPGYFLMALLFFLIGMEEISWGQRLFDIAAPYAVTRLNYQAEFNLHNIIDTHISLRTIFNYAVLLWIFVFPFALRKSFKVREWSSKLGIPEISASHIPFFLLALFFLIFLPIVKSDEVGELLLGIAFILFVIDSFVVQLINENLGLRHMSRIRIRFVVFLAILVVAQFLILFSPGINNLKWHLNHLATAEYPQRNLYKQAEALFQYALKNSSLRFPDTLFSYGLLLREMKSDRSEAVLREALEEQYGQAKENPSRPEFCRNAGKILKLLNQKDRANVEFQKAVSIDQKRLDSAQKDWEKVSALVSIGKTYMEIEEYGLAVDNLQKAYAMTSESQVKLNIDDLINQIEKKDGR